MISIIAKNVVKADQVKAFQDLARELVAETRKEKGCIAYALNQDLKDPTVLTFIERWDDQAAIDAHMKSAHFVRIVPQLGPLTAAPGDMRLYRELV
jgi:quinol monooxygenase YgiN